MKTFKQFLSEMTHRDLLFKAFLTQEMNIHGAAAKEAHEWYHNRLDLDDARTDVKNQIFMYFESKHTDYETGGIDKFDTQRKLRNDVYDHFMEWLEDNNLDDEYDTTTS